jgi:predicted nucleic acid-binding protein
MFLIDTSVWIDYFRGNTTPAVTFFEDILDSDHPFGLTGVIYQEILQGANSESDFRALQKYLVTQQFYYPLNLPESHVAAARLYFRCRRNGITIRSTIDCLIAQIAIEHGLRLVHSDKDFDAMERVIPDLRTYAH